MKNIVITGSTRGIGYGLAEAFLARGCAVTISGRTPEKVEEVVARLSVAYGPERVQGQPCDVRHFAEVQALWDAAEARWGRVDVWVNNAGIGTAQTDFWKHEPEELAAVVQTNVLGAMYGARVALAGMLAQGSGSFYNMEGLGSGDGRRVEGLILYGTTKSALSYLSDALIAETKGSPVLVGALLPGMVATEMLTDPYRGRPEDWERAKPIFNILADRVETVAPWFAEKVLENTKHGVRFRWLTRGKAMARFLMAPVRKRDLFDNGPPGGSPGEAA
jgi:NAD(P)-dependent dehydrogenase (short-subunit alcohol dehydrogenase family)